WNAASAETRLVVEVPVTVTLASDSGGTIRRGDPVSLVGTVADADGPLPLASVEIRVLAEPVAVAQAHATGAFATRLTTRSLPAGNLDIYALFRPTAPWHTAPRSRPVTITLTIPSPPPPAVFLAPALATGLGLLLFWLRRTRIPLSPLARRKRLAPAPAPFS